MGVAAWSVLMTVLLASVLQTSYTQGNGIPGHMLPLGSHCPSEGSIDVVEGFTDPETFYFDYVRGSKPLLFRGAAKSMTAYQQWSDVYLNDRYGGLYVEVESKKKEDRTQEVHLMMLSEFLEQYDQQDIYMVHDVPQEMDEDVGVPKPLLCGGFQDILQNTVIWFSSGETISVLHNDDVDNINCLLDGEKDFFMIDKKYKEDVEGNGFVEKGGYSQVDVEAVDMITFAGLQNLPWWEAHMQAGDCLYIPFKWYHQVNSSRGRNLAVNLWFHHLLWFNHTDCEAYASDLQNDFIPLSHYDVPGPGSPEEIRVELFQEFEFLDNITLEDVVRVWGRSLSNLQVHELFQLLDEDKDLILSWEEVYEADLEVILENFPNLHPGFYEVDDLPSMESGVHDSLGFYDHDEF